MTEKQTAASVADRIADFSVEQLRMFARKLKAEKSPVSDPFRRRNPAANVFPLSFAQEGFWFLEQLMPRHPSFNWVMAVRFQLAMEDKDWQEIFRLLIERQEILRTRYVLREGVPSQIVDPAPSAPVKIVDLRHLAPEEKEASVKEFLAEESQRGFDVETAHLCRFHILQISSGETVLCSSTHLSIIDAWCRKIFMNDLSSLAAARVLGQPAPVPLKAQYGDYAVWERNNLQGDNLDRELAYWKKQLEGVSDLNLPSDYRRPQIQRMNGANETALLPKALTDAIKELAAREGATPFMAHLAIFKTLLLHYVGHGDIAVATPVANRDRVEFETTLGRFVNTLVLRTQIPMHATFRQVLRQVRDTVLSALAHRDLPFELLVRELRLKREPDRNPLSQVMFQFEDIPATDLSTGVLGDGFATPIETGNPSSVWDLSFHIFSDWDRSVLGGSDQLRLVLFYDRDLFSDVTIRRMMGHYERLLESAVKAPDTVASEFSLLTPREERALESWNATPVNKLPHATFTAAFEFQALNIPSRIAVQQGSVSLTFDSLNRSANRLAAYLVRRGIRDGDTVCIALESCFDLVVAAIAVLKTGAAAVFLSPLDPVPYRHQMLQHCAPQAMLIHERHEALAREFSGLLVVLDRQHSEIDAESDQNPPPASTAQSVAYRWFELDRMHEVCHRHLVQRLATLQSLVELTGRDALPQRSPLSTDLAKIEIFWPLAFGARVLSGPTGKAVLCPLAHECGPTVAFAAASELPLLAKSNRPDILHGLRAVFCAGEVPGMPVLRAFFSSAHCRLLHLYVPPEVSVEAAIAEFEEEAPDSWWRPISRRTGNVRIHVLNRFGKPVPVGVAGEVFVEWPIDQVTPDATEKGRIRTGDLARLHPSGGLILEGSLALHGWVGSARIAFAEIESALCREPSVEDCAVTVRQTSDHENQLVAFVVASGLWSPQRLDLCLRSQLPEHLLPQVYVPISCVPFHADGSVDWKALEAVEVLDTQVLSRWERAIEASQGICQVAVVAKEPVRVEQSRLHLQDILPPGIAFGSKPRNEHIVVEGRHSPQPSVTQFSEQNGEIRWSVSDGGPLPLPPEMPANLGQILQRAADLYPQQSILFISSDGSESSLTYEDLLHGARRIAAGLKRAGLTPGNHAILQFANNRDFVLAFWGCILNGVVPVPSAVPPLYATSNSVTSKLINAWRLLNQPVLLTTRSSIISIENLAKQSDLDGLRTATLEDLLQSEPEPQFHQALPEDIALMLLTSGSTGMPKGVPLSHRNLLRRAAAVALRHGLSAQDISLNWMPLDHVGGVVMCHLQDVYHGSAQIHVETEVIMRSPLTWLDLINQYRATITWAPNFAFAMVNDHAGEFPLHQWDLSSMRLVLNGGESIVPRTAKYFMESLEPFGLPKTAMVPTFGMSECCSAVTFSYNFLAENIDENSSFVDIGTPVLGFRVRIVDDNGAIVEEGKVGRMQISGESLMAGYYQNPELNATLFTHDGWFDSGDFGFLSHGSLTLVGRKKDVIIMNGVNFYCHEIESVVEEIPGVEVSFAAACPVRTRGADTDQLAIFFCRQENTGLVEILRQIRAQVTQRMGITPEFVIPVSKDEVPKTSIGKIQRSLLRDRFEAGDFRSTLREIDLLLGNANTLPNWFYKRTWRPRKLAATRDSLAHGSWLVFLDREGLGSSLCEELNRLGRPYATVEMGSQFEKTGSHSYRIEPANAKHYALLASALAEECREPQHVVHLWSYARPQSIPAGTEALDRGLAPGVYSIFHLIRNLAPRSGSPIDLTVITSHSRPGENTEDLSYGRAAVGGLLKTANLENPRLHCREIDFPLRSVKEAFAALLLELRAPLGEVEVLYANQDRMVPGVEPVSLEAHTNELPIKRNGLYLISGGLGGIGVIFGRYLLEVFGVRLILLGRTQLPPREQWPAILEKSGSVEARRLQGYLDLQRAGEIEYHALDVCDADSVTHAVRQCEHRWQHTLDGVFHFAGLSTETLLEQESIESFSAVLHVKLEGARVLSELIAQNPQAIFLSVSSALSLWGATGMAAYCSANDSLEAFSHSLRRRGMRSYCYSWSVWDGIGMSRNFQLGSAYRQRGMLPITANQGVNSLLAALSQEQNHLIIGLDGSSIPLQRYLGSRECQRQNAVAFFSADQRIDIERLQSFVVPDRFNAKTVCRFVELPELPLTGSGQIDRTWLERSDASNIAPGKLSMRPPTEIESRILALWRNVLGMEQVGIHDDFFALGGYSILAAQLMARIRQTFGRDLPLRILLERPTVAHLAEVLQSSTNFEQRSPLVPIQSRGARRPLFLAHPAGGNILCYYELAAELGTDQPVYGLEDISSNAKDVANSIEEMAQSYCEAIRTLQPRGPYSLGGWSLGGVIAFEMAKQLRQQGEDISLLTIIDVEAHGRRESSGEPQGADSVQALMALCGMLEIYTGREVPVRKEDLEGLSANQRAEFVFREMSSRDLLPAEIDLDYFLRYLNIYDSNLRAMNDYTPETYDGKIVVFPSSDEASKIHAPRHEDPTMGWQKHSSVPIAWHRIPGNHLTMMTAPNVRTLARLLQSYLEEKISPLPIVTESTGATIAIEE